MGIGGFREVVRDFLERRFRERFSEVEELVWIVAEVWRRIRGCDA